MNTMEAMHMISLDKLQNERRKIYEECLSESISEAQDALSRILDQDARKEVESLIAKFQNRKKNAVNNLSTLIMMK